MRRGVLRRVSVQVFMSPANLFAAAGLGVMTFISSIFGDLIESSIKREAKMKVSARTALGGDN